MPFRKLQWLFPIVTALHNGEEAIWMPGWAPQHFSQLPLLHPNAFKIRIALLALTAAAFVLTYLSHRKGPQSLCAYLTFGYIVAMLLNVFVPHVPAALYSRSYAPGVVTAVAINLPLMSYLTFRTIRDRWVSGWKAGTASIGVPLALAGLIGFVFYV